MSDVYETYVEIIRTTELAILCDIDGEEVWIPRSQVESGGEIGADASEGDEGLIVLSAWVAREKGLV
jgi:hypothetical protein